MDKLKLKELIKMDWNKFENGELAVKVTPTTVSNFLQACEERGLKWMSGNLPTEYCPGILEYVYITYNSYESLFEGLAFNIIKNYPTPPVVDWEEEMST